MNILFGGYIATVDVLYSIDIINDVGMQKYAHTHTHTYIYNIYIYWIITIMYNYLIIVLSLFLL